MYITSRRCLKSAALNVAQTARLVEYLFGFIYLIRLKEEKKTNFKCNLFLFVKGDFSPAYDLKTKN